MNEYKYSVYVLADSAGRITDITSDAFLPSDVTAWTKIDEGSGDRYHHAQANYLDGPLRDDDGIFRYKLEDGKATARTEAEMEADRNAQPTPAPTPIERVEKETALLTAQVQALSDRGEFVEDCIAEMAEQVYQ